MAFSDELIRAGATFNQGIAAISQLEATRQAASAVEAIKNREVDETGKAIKEIDRRAQIQQVANNLVQQLALTGASPFQIQSQFEAMSPQAQPTPTELITSGFLGEDKETLAQGLQLRELLSPAAPQGKPLSDKSIETLQGMNQSLREAQGIINALQRDDDLAGPVAGRIPFREQLDPKFAAFSRRVKRFILAYQKSISGAQVSDREREFIQEATITPQDTPETIKATLSQLIRIGKKDRAGFLRAQQELGRRAVPESTIRQDPTVAGGDLGIGQFIRRGQ
jgi:hypothetical protein